MHHAEIHQLLGSFGLQMEVRNTNGAVFCLHIRCAEGLVPVRSPALLQNSGAFNVGINWFAVFRQVIAPEFLVLGPALFVLCLFQIADQDFFEGSEGLGIFRAETIMAVKLHNVVDHHDEAGGINEAVVNMDIHSVVAFRHLHHGDLHHGDLRLFELLIGLFLQKSVGFLHGEVGEIQEGNIAVISFRNVLLYIPVFIRCSKPETKALVTPKLVLNASLQKVKINLCLQTGKNTDIAAALSASFPDGQILQHLTYIQGIKFFLHRFSPCWFILPDFQTDCYFLLLLPFLTSFPYINRPGRDSKHRRPAFIHRMSEGIRGRRFQRHQLPVRQYCAHLR